ncbi:MAG: putative zinc-binding protein [Deltaproteobacteria bacterium]
MNDCLCKPAEIMLFACSGAANVGQISNDASFELHKEGKARMFCLAGLGGHVQGIIDATKQAKKIIVVDGCSVACAKKIVELADFSIDDYIVVTDEGIEKVAGKTDFSKEEVQKIKKRIEKNLCTPSA